MAALETQGVSSLSHCEVEVGCGMTPHISAPNKAWVEVQRGQNVNHSSFQTDMFLSSLGVSPE